MLLDFFKFISNKCLKKLIKKNSDFLGERQGLIRDKNRFSQK